MPAEDAAEPPSTQPVPPAVAAGNPVTADVGASVLRAGGSAADAAAAMILTACAAETVFTGLAGGGFAIHHEAATRRTTCLDFFVAVPGLGGRRRLTGRSVPIDFGGQLVPYAVGPATVAVPGVPAGVAELHRRWGRRPWQDLVAPAVEHAARGVSLAPPHAKVLATIAPAMLLGEGERVYAPAGQLLPGGSRLFHPGLETALQSLAEEGADAFYRGRIAAAMAAAVGEAGDLGMRDLAAYSVLETEPRSARLGPAEVRARGADLDDLLGTLDRLKLDSDPATMARRIVAVLRSAPARGDTTSAAAVDAEGNLCAVTTSLGLASGVWVPEFGLHLNSMLGEGELVRGDEEPGMRMGSMMSPLVAFDEKGPRLVAGAAGGSRIRSALVQVLVHLVAHGLPLQEAIEAPRLNPVPARVHAEPGLPEEVLDALRRDDEVVVWPSLDSYFGGVAGVDLTGPGADPRRGGDVRRV